jgi:SAM-dependent methyltransferase
VTTGHRVWLAPLPGADRAALDGFASRLNESLPGATVTNVVVPEQLPVGAQLKWALARAITSDADYLVTIAAQPASESAAIVADAIASGVDVAVSPNTGQVGALRQWATAWGGTDVAYSEAPLSVYRCAFVAGVPFDRCDRGDLFEWEFLLQLIAHGASFRALPSGQFGTRQRRSRPLRTLRAAIRARLHTLGAFLDDRLPPHPEYRYHRHPHSSHGQLLQWLARPEGARRLLDVGAGSGHFAKEMVAAGYTVTCLEGVPERAAECERVTRTYQVDLDKPFELDGVFDVIVLADVLEHLRTPDLLVERLRRHLSAGGVMVISVPNVGNIIVRLLVLFGMFPYGRQGILDRTHVRFFTAHSLDRLLTQAGLDIVRRGATTLPFFLIVAHGAARMALGAVEQLYSVLVRIWPALFAYQLLRVARPFPEHE